MFATSLPLPLYPDTDGKPLDAGYLFFGVANANPETSPLTVYWDEAGTQPASQPVRTRNGMTARNGKPAQLFISGDYSLTVKNARGELVLYAATAVAADAFLQSGTGAVLRRFADKLADIYSVKDFGATGDGVTVEQTQLVKAVAAAFAAGKRLFWPDGTYVSNASIPNFHAVKHFGPGVLKRGADLFHVEPSSSDTNIIYLSTTGGGAADGLSSSEPLDTLTNAWAAIANYGPHLKGKWKVVHAAGTYSGYHRVPYHLSSEKLVELIGPDVGGHPNVPTAIYDDNGAAEKVVSCVNRSMKIKVKDIKAQEYQSTAISMTGGLLVCENVHTLDCYIGIGCAEGTLYVAGGLHSVSAGYVTGYARIQSIFGNKHNVGYSYDETTGNPTQAASLAATPQITAGNFSGRGVHCQENSTGHVYALIQGFSKGVELVSRSRANLDSTDFRLNVTALEIEFGCDAGGTPVYNKGTANENTISVRSIGGGMDYSAYPSPGTALEYRVAQDLAGESVTGITTVEQIGGTLYTLSGQDFDEGGSTLRMVVVGTITGTAGTKSIHLRVAGTNVGSVPFTSTAVGAFHAEITLRQTAGGAQLVTGWGIAGAAAVAGVADAGHGTSAVDIADGTSKAVTCTVQLGNAADTIDVDLVELYRTN